MPGWPSWQLLTSAANLGKLPARDRGKQQRKSEQVSKWVPPASSRCILHSFSLQQALQLHRLDLVEWEPPTVSRGWGCPRTVLSFPSSAATGGCGLDSRPTPSPYAGYWRAEGPTSLGAASRPGLVPCELSQGWRPEHPGSWIPGIAQVTFSPCAFRSPFERRFWPLPGLPGQL